MRYFPSGPWTWSLWVDWRCWLVGVEWGLMDFSRARMVRVYLGPVVVSAEQAWHPQPGRWEEWWRQAAWRSWPW